MASELLHGSRLDAVTVGLQKETVSQPNRNAQDLVSSLFSDLDNYGVRYCVLHSWERLPESLPSDLDLAVHPDDAAKISLVVKSMRQRGYLPIQMVNYAVNGWRYDFAYLEDQALCCIGVDIIFDYREGGLVLTSGEQLVSGRRQYKNFWVADPKTEFEHLLVRKTLKGNLPADQAQRLKLLVEEIGQSQAAKISGQLFGDRWKIRVVKDCANGCLVSLLSKLRRPLWLSTIRRSPLNPVRYLAGDALRLARRWLRPTGLFLVVLGPDGVGKSTLVSQLVKGLGPAFRGHRVFHWRPMLLWRRKNRGGTTQPHSHPQRPAWCSVVCLLAQLLDYWAGYWLVVRQALARSGLVIFDRYFDDLLIDARRYRYGGPTWLVRVICPLIPRPNLVLVLDAPTEVVISRKREVPIEEVERQRREYLDWANRVSRSRVIETYSSSSNSVVRLKAEHAVTEYLSRRLEYSQRRCMA